MVKERTIRKVANFMWNALANGDAKCAYTRLSRMSPENQRKVLNLFNQKAFSVAGNKKGAEIILNFAGYRGGQKALREFRRGMPALTEQITQTMSSSVNQAVTQAREQTVQYINSGDFYKDLGKAYVGEMKRLGSVLIGKVTRPYYTRQYAKIPAQYKSVVDRICKAETSEGHIQTSYNELKKLLGNTGTIDNTVTVSKSKDFFGISDMYATDCLGGFDFVTNKISFESAFRHLPKSEQTALIGHELIHAKQVEDIVRTFGIERYIQLLEQRKGAKLTAEEIQTVMKSFEPIINKSRFALNSPEGVKATKDLEAFSTYKAAYRDTNGKLVRPKEYKSIVEDEAYGFQGMLSRIFRIREKVQAV